MELKNEKQRWRGGSGDSKDADCGEGNGGDRQDDGDDEGNAT